MSYSGFLVIFLGIPIALLSLITIYDYQRGKWMPSALHSFKSWKVLIGLCSVALIYTTPWDNYLVATSVWCYDINLVSGIVFGYVPIEEYIFFLIQPIMTGLLFLLIVRYLPINPQKANNPKIRIFATSIAVAGFAFFTFLLIMTVINDIFRPMTYLSLELSWALIPIIIQFAFGADILWRHRNAILLTIIISTIYLSWADSIAIAGGTWTIDPEQSLNWLIGGVLPIEEFIFFLITSTLVTLGMTLLLAEESQSRAMKLEKYPVFRPFLNSLIHENSYQSTIANAMRRDLRLSGTKTGKIVEKEFTLSEESRI